jgi:hypothetical protein
MAGPPWLRDGVAFDGRPATCFHLRYPCRLSRQADGCPKRAARRLFQPAQPTPENTMHQAARSMPELNDSALLRSQAYVDGAWCGAASAATFEVSNPADGAVIASVPDMGAADANLLEQHAASEPAHEST